MSQFGLDFFDGVDENPANFAPARWLSMPAAAAVARAIFPPPEGPTTTTPSSGSTALHQFIDARAF